MTELREWVDNPLTKGPFSMRSGDGVEFAQAELRSGVSSLLNGPSLEPVFVRLRGVRVRVRFLASSAGSTAVLNNVDASVAPTLRDDPSNPLIPSYFAKAAATPAVWQILDLLPQRGFGYPAVVDARWLYLTFGRSGDIQVDIDWIELVR